LSSKIKDAILSALVFLVIYIAGAYDFTLNTYIIALFTGLSPVSRIRVLFAFGWYVITSPLSPLQLETLAGTHKD
jgi:hypothetical protein